VTPATFAEAEKLVQLEMTAAERAVAASNWRMQTAPLLEKEFGVAGEHPPGFGSTDV
jgi:hypothetical protein